MLVPSACPSCNSSDIRYRERRGDWFCDACDHSWSAEQPPVSASQLNAAVFVSYGHADATDFVTRLRAELEQRGISPIWLDLEMIDAGDEFWAAMQKGIEQSDALLAVMTPYSVRPDSVCWREIAFADDRGKRIVPLRVDTNTAVRANVLLVGRSWADFASHQWDDAVDRLLRGLAGDEQALQPVGVIGGLAPLVFAPEVSRHLQRFTGREWLDRELDAWLARDVGRLFWVVGEPGIGKSAIAAHLTTREDVAAWHFCSTSNSRTLDPREFTAAVASALSQRLPGFEAALASRHPELPRERAMTAFRELVVEPALSTQPPGTTQLLVVDALDEARRGDGETIVDLLVEHAPSLPPWLRIVATTRPDAEVLGRLDVLGCVTVDAESASNLADLETYVRARLEEPVLAETAKGTPDLPERILEAAAGNFLYAQMALRLIESSSAETIDVSAMPAGLPGLYNQMFRQAFPDRSEYRSRYETVLTCLAAAFAPLPWGTLERATGLAPRDLGDRLDELSSFVRTEGSGTTADYSLFHRSFAEWLRTIQRGQPYAVDAKQGHARLAEALEGQHPQDEYAVRWLPRHLIALEDWSALGRLLANLGYLTAAWNVDKYDVLRHWALLQQAGVAPADVYSTVLTKPDAHAANELRPLAWLLRRMGLTAEAERLYSVAVAMLRHTEGQPELGRVLNEYALVVRSLGSIDEARGLLAQAESISRSEGDRFGLQACLNSQALIHMAAGDTDTALALFAETETICREDGLLDSLESAVFNRASIARRLGQLEEAERLFAEAERLSREVANPARLANVLGAQAGMRQRKGELDGALRLQEEREQIHRSLGNLGGISAALRARALVHLDREEYTQAAALLGEAWTTGEQVGKPAKRASLLESRARLLRETGESAAALQLLLEAERIYRDLRQPAQIADVLIQAGATLAVCGDAKEALARADQAEELLTELPRPWLRQQLLGVRANALSHLAKHAESLDLTREQEALCRRLSFTLQLGNVLERKSACLEILGQREAALAAIQEAHDIARSIGADVPAMRRASILHRLENVVHSETPPHA